MDIEYGCYVSNRYDDFLNVSENESHCRNDAIIANGKQKNKSKQRKKRKSKRNRKRLSGENIAIAIENGNGDVGLVNEVAEKPLDVAVSPAKEIVTEVVEPGQPAETIDSVEQVPSGGPHIVSVEHNADAIESPTEVKWSQICIEEDKAIAERNRKLDENGERKYFATICYYNSNFGNGNRFVRLGNDFRYRRRDRIRTVARNDQAAMEKSESEHTESVNDCNNNDMAEMENGKMDHVNDVPKKRKRTKKKIKNRAAKLKNASVETIDGGAVHIGDAAHEPHMIANGKVESKGNTVANGDVISNDDRKITIRKRRNSKFQRMQKSNSVEKQNNEQINEQSHIDDGKIANGTPNGTIIVNSHGPALPHINKNINSQAAKPDNHIHAARTTDADNVNKSKRSRFGRRKRNPATQKIEWSKNKHFI